MNQTKNNSRRRFLQVGGASLIGSLLLAKTVLNSDVAFAQGDAPMLKEDDPQAKNLGYVADAKKVDTKKWPKRAGAEGGKQYCYNCQFYQAKGDAKSSKSAPCAIFPGKQVAGQGWCNTWTQNPNVKG